MHKTTLYLDEGIYERIKRMAEASGKTQAEIIRDALVAHLDGPPRRPRSVGLGRSERGDVASRDEELLDGFGEDR